MTHAEAIQEATAHGLDPDTRPNARNAATAEYLLAKEAAAFERAHRQLMAGDKMSGSSSESDRR